MSAHALLPPSGGKRWMACPGSVAACKGVPRTDSVYSEEGTFCHDVAATLLLRDEPHAVQCVGPFMFKDGEGKNQTRQFTTEQAAAVQVYLDAIAETRLFDGGELFVEVKVSLTSNIYGTADAILWDSKRCVLHVFDLKMGVGVYVPAEHNEQLMIYACAFLASKGYDPRMLKGCTLHIVQPRFVGAEPHRTYEVSAEELTEFRRLLAEAEIAALAPGAPLVPGEHCQFCNAKPTCPALLGQAMTTAQEVFPLLDPMQPVAPPLVESLTADRLAAVLKAADTAEQWIKAVREHAFERAQKGDAIPGWKLVEKIGNRKWVDEKAAAATLTQHGIDPYEKSIKSPAQIEKITAAAKPLVQQLTVRPITGMSLVPESDKRPAANPTAAFSILPSAD